LLSNLEVCFRYARRCGTSCGCTTLRVVSRWFHALMWLGAARRGGKGWRDGILGRLNECGWPSQCVWHASNAVNNRLARLPITNWNHFNFKLLNLRTPLPRPHPGQQLPFPALTASIPLPFISPALRPPISPSPPLHMALHFTLPFTSSAIHSPCPPHPQPSASLPIPSTPPALHFPSPALQ